MWWFVSPFGPKTYNFAEADSHLKDLTTQPACKRVNKVLCLQRPALPYIEISSSSSVKTVINLRGNFHFANNTRLSISITKPVLFVDFICY